MGVFKYREMFILKNTKWAAGLIISCLFFISCNKTKSFNISIKAPNEVFVKKDSIENIYLTITNNSQNQITIDKIKSSCQCIISSRNQIKLNPEDSEKIKVTIHGNIMGDNIESLLFTSEILNSFKIYRLKYEVIN